MIKYLIAFQSLFLSAYFAVGIYNPSYFKTNVGLVLTVLFGLLQIFTLSKISNTPRAFTLRERADEYQATAHDEKQGIDTSAGASNSGGRHDS